MKKILRLSVVFFVMLTMFSLMGCGEKTVVSLKDFNSLMEKKGYTIKDATEQITPARVQAISLAIKEDYQIEFYVFKDTRTAESVFAQNKLMFENNKSSGYIEQSRSFQNNSYYSLVSGGNFYLLSRVDHTMIYVVADADYKKEITETIKELGY